MGSHHPLSMVGTRLKLPSKEACTCAIRRACVNNTTSATDLLTASLIDIFTRILFSSHLTPRSSYSLPRQYQVLALNYCSIEDPLDRVIPWASGVPGFVPDSSIFSLSGRISLIFTTKSCYASMPTSSTHRRIPCPRPHHLRHHLHPPSQTSDPLLA